MIQILTYTLKLSVDLFNLPFAGFKSLRIHKINDGHCGFGDC